jgi:hypothetical protein
MIDTFTALYIDDIDATRYRLKWRSEIAYIFNTHHAPNATPAT